MGKTRGVASNRWPFYEAQLTTAILQRAADQPRILGCLLLALSGRAIRADECPLSGVKWA